MKRNKRLALSVSAALIMFLFVSGCTKTEKEEEPNLPDIDMMEEMQEKQEDNPDYEVKSMEMSTEERAGITGKLSSVMKKCSEIYSQIEIDETLNTILKEEEIHRLIELIARDGSSAVCGNRDDNMKNYKRVDESLKLAEQGEKTETDFYSVNKSGVFRYYRLQFEEGRLFVTFASAVYNKSLEPVFQQMEKILAYQWEYTEKGWLIWEKALSRNQEMDMHIFYRILPLDSECRRLSKKCIEPVSYFSNNLFLRDWDASDLSQLEFNDLFDSFYYMSSGRRPNKDIFRDGIPKEEFEDTIQRYLDIETGELEQRAFYDKKKGTYPWLAITGWNRLPQLQPFPEVTDCREHGDGILDLYVDAVFVEEGTDRAFSHVVTVKEKDDGGFVYLGNKIDQEHVLHMPVYRPRREF